MTIESVPSPAADVCSMKPAGKRLRAARIKISRTLRRRCIEETYWALERVMHAPFGGQTR
jgi:hypothetical protein